MCGKKPGHFYFVFSFWQQHMRKNLPLKTPDNFRNKFFQKATRSAFQKALWQELATKGYFFPHLLNFRQCVDSSNKRIRWSYLVALGKRTVFQQAHFTWGDTLEAELTEKIQQMFQALVQQPYTKETLQDWMHRVVRLLENSGYPFAKIETRSFTLHSLDSLTYGIRFQFVVTPGEKVHLYHLAFPGKSPRYQKYLERVIHFHSGELYRWTRVQKYLRRLLRLDFIKTIKNYQLVKNKSNRFLLKIHLEEAPATSIDGIVGYIPPPATTANQKGYMTGQVRLGFRNFLGPGRRLHIEWQKQDRWSEQFQLRYREPFVFQLPFGLEIGLHRLIRDTTYVEWKNFLTVDFPLSEKISAFATFTSREVTPDTLASRQKRLPHSRSVQTETGILLDARDNVQNPRKGIYFRLAAAVWKKRILGPSYLIYEDSLLQRVTLNTATVDFSLFISPFHHQVFAVAFHTALVGGSRKNIQLSDLVWFGGARTVRGFREDQFFAEQVAWLKLEYRFLLGPVSRFFFFTDNAYFQRKVVQPTRRWITGYGMGFRIPSPLGIMQMELGWEKGAPFREGKVHFRLINEF